MSWNEEAKISCQFAFKCPKTWGRLTPTEDANIRHCSECHREVHLALTEEDFRRHSEAGHCLAVRVLQPDSTEAPRMLVGEVSGPSYHALRQAYGMQWGADDRWGRVVKLADLA